MVSLDRTRRGLTGLSSQLSQPPNSASSVDLTSADHEAIRYFRTTFAKMHHTKNPDYSLYAIIFNIAEREAMVMRVVLALGCQEIEFRRRSSPVQAVITNARQTEPWLTHYGAALRLMAETIGRIRDGRQAQQFDLDAILAALYLMFMYEKQYGDATGLGLRKHLEGAAKFVKHRFRNGPPPIIGVTESDDAEAATTALDRMTQTQQRLDGISLFSARLLVHLAAQDAFAATFGMGGQIMSTLNEMMRDTEDDNLDMPYQDGMDNLHRFSYSLYRTMWADNYPQKELLDDLENRSVFALAASTSQLRFMISQLGTMNGTKSAAQQVNEVKTAIQLISFRFSEILAVGKELSSSTDNSSRLVTNIRIFVPQFYAVQLEFRRVKRSLGLEAKSPSASEKLVGSIMRLALQAFKHRGDEGVIGIGWPLYIVALETTNLGYREWVLSRFQKFSSYGKNYQRAYEFLARLGATGSQEYSPGEAEASTALFVL